MTRQQFAARLAEDGPDLELWPARPRREARALLLRSAGCRRRFLRALETDAALAHATLTSYGVHHMAARLGAQLADTPQRRAGLSRRATLRGAALAACVAVGLAIGWYGTETRGASPLVYAAADLTPFSGSGE